MDAVVSRSDAVSTPLAELVAREGTALTRFAYLLCGDRAIAEDLVQDTYLALYRRFGPDLPLASPFAYARRAVVNANISRSRRPSPLLPGDDLPDVPAAVAVPDEQDAMWRALATLPPRQRAVLVLRYYADLPDAQIAIVLDCQEGTVRSLAARAFAALRVHPALAEESR